MNSTNTIDIMDDDFEVPVIAADLQELIEASIVVYEAIPQFDKTRRHYRAKLNELIAEYNERRGMNIYTMLRT